MNGHFGKKLRELRRRKGLTQQSLAVAANLHQRTIAGFEAQQSPPEKAFSSYAAIAKALGMTAEELDETWKNVKRPVPSNFTIPRISHVAATGFTDFEVDLNTEEGVPGALYPYPEQEPMVLRVRGSSMSGIGGIEDGDDVIFANALEEEIPLGTIVVARDLEGQTVKILEAMVAETVTLRPYNPKFPPLTRRRDQLVLRPVKVIINNLWQRK